MSRDPRMPHADVTNAPHLFGDPMGDVDLEDGDLLNDEMGDYEDGEVDYGDVDYGDPDVLAVYSNISGDPAPRSHKVRSYLKKHKRALMTGTALTAGAVGAVALARAVKKARAKRMLVKQKLRAAKSHGTLTNQRIIRNNIGKMRRDSMMPFFSLRGAKMNESPIDPLSTFVADMFKNLLDRQNSDTPFYQETAIGTFAAGTWTAQANGVVANRFFTGLIVQIGTNELNASPGTIISMTATIPTISGTLTIAATPFLFTYEKGYDVRFLFFPWTLVSNKPLPVLGQYSNANPIIVAITGIPSASSVNLVVPGSLHPWTVAMRNALIQP